MQTSIFLQGAIACIIRTILKIFTRDFTKGNVIVNVIETKEGTILARRRALETRVDAIVSVYSVTASCNKQL